ncbi:hypothetical protein, partial [Pseudomonas sp. FW301-21D1A]|jgi:hypothetical protein|uniref:hypothetical protein n=1 Tax=Pseudomonas sp. FW301-21D1A TaxID=2751321 RepID=UPI001A92F629
MRGVIDSIEPECQCAKTSSTCCLAYPTLLHRSQEQQLYLKLLLQNNPATHADTHDLCLNIRHRRNTKRSSAHEVKIQGRMIKSNTYNTPYTTH